MAALVLHFSFQNSARSHARFDVCEPHPSDQHAHAHAAAIGERHGLGASVVGASDAGSSCVVGAVVDGDDSRRYRQRSPRIAAVHICSMANRSGLFRARSNGGIRLASQTDTPLCNARMAARIFVPATLGGLGLFVGPHHSLFRENTVRYFLHSLGSPAWDFLWLVFPSANSRLGNAEDFGCAALRLHPAAEVFECVHAPSLSHHARHCKAPLHGAQEHSYRLHAVMAQGDSIPRSLNP